MCIRDSVKAMYDYLDYIISNGSNILGIAMHYPHSQKKFNEIIQHFLDIAFKPLIDFINDAISKEMILMEEQKPLGVTQNIGTVYGTVNQQGGGTVSYTHLLPQRPCWGRYVHWSVGG